MPGINLPGPLSLAPQCKNQPWERSRLDPLPATLTAALILVDWRVKRTRFQGTIHCVSNSQNDIGMERHLRRVIDGMDGDVWAFRIEVALPHPERDVHESD